MLKGTFFLVGCLVLGTHAAHADIGSTVGLYSDYEFRGVSLSSRDPALQASLDWSGEMFYASLWGSNIDYGEGVDGDIEIDIIAGLAGGEEGKLTWDVGGVYYTYPDSDDSATKEEIKAYPEIYAGAGYGIFDAKLWYSWDYGGTDEDSYYLEGNLNFSLPWELGLKLHAGTSFGDAFDNGASYEDYAVTLSRTFGHFDVAVKGVTTNLSDDYEGSDHAFDNDARLVFSVSTTFPWTKAEE